MEISLKPMSPSSVDSQVAALLRALGLQHEKPQLLSYVAPDGFTPALVHCHWNTWEQSLSAGGGVQPGWMLFQDKRANFAEAIFHSVWISPEGELIDVTPRQDGEIFVLFVPDPARSILLSEHEGRPAIWTYQNAKMHGHRILSHPERFKAVLMDGYTESIGLYPWPSQGADDEAIDSA